MKLMRALVPIVVLMLLVAAVLPGASPSSETYKPEAETLRAIKEREDKLQKILVLLRNRGVKDALLTDVEIFHTAAERMLQQKGFYEKESAQWTIEALDQGLLRAAQLAGGDMPWLSETGHAVVRAYRSGVDGSLQPFAVTFPKEYHASEQDKKWRLDIVLHGKDEKLTDVKFIHQHNGEKEIPSDRSWIQLDIFGRGNNGYRWAGETDIREASAHFHAVEQLLSRGHLIDRRRAVLRGFSMGGMGTWQLGLHEPDQWSVIGPSAGMCSTRGALPDLPAKLPSYQEACLHIYDSLDYAENAVDVPIVAYAGSEDKAMKALERMKERLGELKIDMTLLVGKGLGHTFPEEWQRKAEAEYSKRLTKENEVYPRRIRFVTYTLRYAHSDWVEILALGQHYQRAMVDAEVVDNAEKMEEGYKVKTANVQALHLGLRSGASREPVKVTIDGQVVEALPYQARADSHKLELYLERQGKTWMSVLPEKLTTQWLREPRKLHLLQGPIDDAFMAPFLCVRGRGRGWHEATDSYAEANLQRFVDEWSRYMHGELEVKDDDHVTPQDIATHHLILFGDPSSNRLIQQCMQQLPFRWTKEKIVWDGKEYDSAEHVPVLIYPSPLAIGHYVVLNSGHTFHAEDFQGSSFKLYPRLGDHALLKLTADMRNPLEVEVIRAGLFTDNWKWAQGERPDNKD